MTDILQRSAVLEEQALQNKEAIKDLNSRLLACETQMAGMNGKTFWVEKILWVILATIIGWFFGHFDPSNILSNM